MFARGGRFQQAFPTGRLPARASAPAGRARLLERVEAAAQERDHRVDRRRHVGGALRLLLRVSAAALGQDVERGGKGGGDDLWTNVVRRCVEVFGDRRGNQLLELGDPGSQVAA
jgi:hypothetical protein